MKLEEKNVMTHYKLQKKKQKKNIIITQYMCNIYGTMISYLNTVLFIKYNYMLYIFKTTKN